MLVLVCLYHTSKIPILPPISDVAKLSSGDVLVLENLRFYPHEGSKDKEKRMEMAKKLASYADLYVSDAFGTAHRDAASMTGVPEV